MIEFILGAVALYAAASAYLLLRADVHPTESRNRTVRALRGPFDAIMHWGEGNG